MISIRTLGPGKLRQSPLGVQSPSSGGMYGVAVFGSVAQSTLVTPQGAAGRSIGPGKLRQNPRATQSPPSGGIYGLAVFGSAAQAALNPLGVTQAAIVRRAGPAKLRPNQPAYTIQPSVAALSGVGVFGSTNYGLVALPIAPQQAFEPQTGPSNAAPFSPTQFTPRPGGYTQPLAIMYGDAIFGSTGAGSLSGVGGITGLSVIESAALGALTGQVAGALSGISIGSSATYALPGGTIAFTGTSASTTIAYAGPSGAAPLQGTGANSSAVLGGIAAAGQLNGTTAVASALYGNVAQSTQGAISGFAIFESVPFGQITSGAPLQGGLILGSVASGNAFAELLLSGVGTYGSVLSADGQQATSLYGLSIFGAAGFAIASTASVRYGYALVKVAGQTGLPVANVAIVEQSACFVAASYFDESGNPFVPVAVSYRVDDVLTDSNIVPWTAVTPAFSNTVTVTSAQNAMISNSRNWETHQVMFEITDSYGNVDYAVGYYDVLHVAGLN